MTGLNRGVNLGCRLRMGGGIAAALGQMLVLHVGLFARLATDLAETCGAGFLCPSAFNRGWHGIVPCSVSEKFMGKNIARLASTPWCVRGDGFCTFLLVLPLMQGEMLGALSRAGVCGGKAAHLVIPTLFSSENSAGAKRRTIIINSCAL